MNEFDALLARAVEQARALGIPVSARISPRVAVNRRAVTRFGCCIRRGGEYVIELSERLLEAEERAWGIRCADGQADTGRVIRLLFVFLCTLGGRFQYRERFAPAHQLGILAAPEALAAGEQPDGLQQVRLALAVVAAEDGQLPAGGKAGGSDVPVILDFK